MSTTDEYQTAKELAEQCDKCDKQPATVQFEDKNEHSAHVFVFCRDCGNELGFLGVEK